MMKKMIFHIPLRIDPKRHSASQIRPSKMIKAFEKIGYEVDVVEGTASIRKKKILEIKKNLDRGIKYDFVYSESSTMPTLLTESHHLPTHPFLDFNFFKFCKHYGIKIGLFYRDIYWCFPDYLTNWKRRIAKKFYIYDLHKYNQLLDILFVPSIEMMEKVSYPIVPPLVELPSGADICLKASNNNSTKIEIFYVGGIGSHYDLTMLVKSVRKFSHIHLTICCRETDWNNIKQDYESILSNNISIIHKSGKELDSYYQKADICSLFLAPSEYRNFAMPYKLMEYLGHGKPVLVSAETKSAQFLEKNGCGIIVRYDQEALDSKLASLNHNDIRKLQQKVIDYIPSQSWDARAREVRDLLTVSVQKRRVRLR